jgi:hypothetical protein
MSFSAIFGSSWGIVVTKSSRGMASSASKWLGIIDLLPVIHERLMRLQVEHADFRDIFRRYDTPNTFLYVDPPYVPETRRSGGSGADGAGSACDRGLGCDTGISTRRLSTDARGTDGAH